MYKIIGADGKEYGPISLAQLRQWREEGRVNHETRVWPENATDWKRLGDLPEFQSATGTTLPPPGFQPIGATSADSVPNYLTPAVLVTLCCCMPLGIVALVHAAQVKTHLRYGDVLAAQECSSKARFWCWLAFGLGCIFIPLYVIVMLATGSF